MYRLIGRLLLLPIYVVFWFAMWAASMCGEKGGSWRLLGVFVALVIGGLFIGLSYLLFGENGSSVSSVLWWTGLAVGIIISVSGIWKALTEYCPVPEDVIHRKAQEEARAGVQEECEKMIRNDPLDSSAWHYLSNLYLKEQRWKDMENALKMSLKADAAKLGWEYSLTYMQLGLLYLAALSVSLRGKGIPVLGYTPSNVTAETLGYSIEELHKLAKENLSKAREKDKKAGYKEEDLKELDLALNAADALSIEAFEEFDGYKEEERQKGL